MDHSLHSMFKPIQMNGTYPNSYYVEKIPAVGLMAYVACYWESGSLPNTHADVIWREGREPSVMTVPARVLPDGCTDMLITYDPVCSEHSYAYCGNYTQPFAVPEPSDDGSPAGDYTFGVRFFPGGAHVFHGMPLEWFTDKRVALQECWPEKLNELQERMAETNCFAERVEVMNAYLSPLSVQASTSENDLMKNVLHRIFIDGGRMTVQELAMREVISERQLHRKFSEWVGISPKRFSEVVRFHRVLSDIHQGNTTDWAMLAQNHGFFDQAHLIRQFRKFYGETPLTAAREHGRMLSDLYNRSVEPSVILKW
ncbi:helix-turn-helix domain-containing protein [Paenibacillus sp. LS1]|uniref:helix-turn-helix domain-containing protein n=1 Tax=Paenibacillus sp. LS1 TaxID=2992120 RepID=UPI002232C371|nr:helix-turn-helix domain-containing protein [Paenibacillus sp. LS1]MCW3793592.1 helix-turn-helix domain-containing protein [Paenibacillus sp. LS1]